MKIWLKYESKHIIHKAQTCDNIDLHTQNALLSKHKIYNAQFYIHHKGLLLCAQ